jgi:hypothetical protein
MQSSLGICKQSKFKTLFLKSGAVLDYEKSANRQSFILTLDFLTYSGFEGLLKLLSDKKKTGSFHIFMVQLVQMMPMSGNFNYQC